MSLPNIKSATFTVKIKELSKALRVRPMTFGEHKTIQQAVDLGSDNDTALTIANVVEACTDGVITSKTVPQYILDYIFLNLYMTSVESVISSRYTCNAFKKDEDGNELIDEETGDKIRCNSSIDVKLPINKTKIMYVENYEEIRRLVLSPDVTLLMKGLTLEANVEAQEKKDEIIDVVNEIYAITDLESQESKDLVESLNNKIKELRVEAERHYFFNSIEKIETPEKELLPGVDFNNDEDFDSWINSCPRKGLENLAAFFDSTPAVGLDLHITCPECSHSEELKLRGLQDFFS